MHRPNVHYRPIGVQNNEISYFLNISWMYHNITEACSDVGLSSLQVQGPGTIYLTIFVIHRSAPESSYQHWRHSSSQRTRTRSAVEASCVLCCTNWQSSSSSVDVICRTSVDKVDRFPTGSRWVPPSWIHRWCRRYIHPSTATNGVVFVQKSFMVRVKCRIICTN